jgi:two-component system sensor histidine kinase KdpD
MISENLRPDPDALLEQVTTEERRRGRGRLTIFLGYAAGVGKTYAMLNAGHQRKQEGADVVIGYVETHKRAETEELRSGLEEIPAKEIEYKGVNLREFDIDAALARRPEKILVDELAHTNAPDSRHTKRYQDVEELLANGVSVYTTLNIQHIESLNDVVAQITGIQVKETLPDRILDEADEIKLVDLPPEELQQRLKEGKVYIPGQAQRALQKFFRLGNLNALREIALRQTAERVGEKMRTYMETHAIPGPWHAEERVLVCLGPTPTTEHLVRAARRLADELHGDLLAIYVETGVHNRLDEASKERVRNGLQLAEELGAKTTVLAGSSVANSILDFAKRHNITKIVVGKTLRPIWLDLLRGSLVDYLIRHSGNLDIYVISGRSEQPQTIPVSGIQAHFHWADFGLATFFIAIATLVSLPLRSVVEPTNLVMIYLLMIMLVALRFGLGPSLYASVLGVLSFDFFMIPPYYTFAVSDLRYLFTFVTLLIVGLLTSSLAVRARDQAEVAQRRTLLTSELYDFTRDLAAATDLENIFKQIAKHVSQTLRSQVAIFLQEGSRLNLHTGSAGFQPGPEEQATAYWVFQHETPAGQGTETLAGSRGRYLPLRTGNTTVGVLGILLPENSSLMDEDQNQLLDAFCIQAAVAIERLHLEEQARRVEVMTESEKLQTALLNSISHDLRTPLVSITGALTAFQENSELKGKAREELLQTALGEANRLNRLVGNLLDMTRLEGGAIKPIRQSVDVREIVEVALEEYKERLTGRPVEISISNDLPFIHVDPILIGSAVGNVIDNALKYSPSGSVIILSAALRNGWVDLEIKDRGPGIPSDELTQVFNKFHRVNRPNQLGGTGLGLSISKGLVEANGGTISLANQPHGGLSVTISLPTAKNENEK